MEENQYTPIRLATDTNVDKKKTKGDNVLIFLTKTGVLKLLQ